MVEANRIDFSGATKPSNLEKDSYELDLFAQRITEVPSNMQMRADYDVRTDVQPVYLGFGAKGLAASSDGWLIYKFTYDGSDRMTLRQIAYDAWDDRGSASYE